MLGHNISILRDPLPPRVLALSQTDPSALSTYLNDIVYWMVDNLVKENKDLDVALSGLVEDGGRGPSHLLVGGPVTHLVVPKLILHLFCYPCSMKGEKYKEKKWTEWSIVTNNVKMKELCQKYYAVTPAPSIPNLPIYCYLHQVPIYYVSPAPHKWCVPLHMLCFIQLFNWDLLALVPA